MTPKSRYPGIRAFEEDEQFLFFGRNDEIRRLHAQVLANTLVVLFAKSGIGKSSLLSAGLVPLLDYDRFQTLKVRFQNTALNPTETLKKALEGFLNAEELQAQTGFSPEEAPLWEYVRACRFERYEEAAEPVLIFDQFEEFFEHPAAERQRFVREIADLVANRLPRRIYESKGLHFNLSKLPDPDSFGTKLSGSLVPANWRVPVPIKVIFAIRSDRMSFLHDLGVDIPAILQNRFELRPLDRAAAREAIVQPASISGRELATKPFAYDPSALDVMLDALENRNAEVESFQLQLICQYIEKQIIRNPAFAATVDDPAFAKATADDPAFAKATAGKPVDTSLFGGAEGIQNILQNYYEDTLAELPTNEQTLARDFIERGLIVGGRRVGVTEGVEREVWKIEPDLLKMLLDSRLVRAEITHLGKSFEISHDAMVEPIARSFRVREAARLERVAAEQREIAERERRFKEKAERDARRARLLSFASLLLLLLTLGIGIFSLSNSRENLVNQANDKLANQQYDEAVNAYDQVLDNGLYQATLYDRRPLEMLRDSALHMKGIKDYVFEGDTLYFAGKYWDALQKYESARRFGYQNLDEKIRRTDDIRSNTLEIYRRKALVFEEAHDPRDKSDKDGAKKIACEYYCLALSLAPDSPELQEKVRALGCGCGKK